MDKKLRKDILKAIHDNDYALEFGDLKQILVEKFGHERVVDNHLDVFSSRVRNYLNTMEEAGFVIVNQGKKNITSIHTTFYSLTDKGYAELAPWYMKSWKFFTEDFTKLLSVVALLLSIVATAISLLK